MKIMKKIKFYIPATFIVFAILSEGLWAQVVVEEKQEVKQKISEESNKEEKQEVRKTAVNKKAKKIKSPFDPGDSIFLGAGVGILDSALIHSSLKRRNAGSYRLFDMYFGGTTLQQEDASSRTVEGGYVSAGFHDDEFSKEVSHTFKVVYFSSSMEKFQEINYLNKKEDHLNPSSAENQRFSKDDYKGNLNRTILDYTAEFHLLKKENGIMKIRNLGLLFSVYGFRDKFEIKGSRIQNYSFNTGSQKFLMGNNRFIGNMHSGAILKLGLNIKPKISESQSLSIELFGHVPSLGSYSQQNHITVLNTEPAPGTAISWQTSPVVHYVDKMDGIFKRSKGKSFKLGYTYNPSSPFQFSIIFEGSYSKITYKSQLMEAFYPLEYLDYLFLPVSNASLASSYLIKTAYLNEIVEKDQMGTIGFEMHYKY